MEFVKVRYFSATVRQYENLASRVQAKSNKIRQKMTRLNSGIKNRNNFLPWAIFLFQKIGSEIVEIFANILKLRGWYPYAWAFHSQNNEKISYFAGYFDI